MPSRIKQIGRKDEVVRVPLIFTYMPHRSWTRNDPRTTGETSAFLSHALCSSRLLDERRW